MNAKRRPRTGCAGTREKTAGCAVYLSVEELIRILEESKKTNNKPTQTGGRKP
jgi:hypothetical protein